MNAMKRDRAVSSGENTNTNTNTNTKYTCDTGQTRNKLLAQWVHLTNHGDGLLAGAAGASSNTNTNTTHGTKYTCDSTSTGQAQHTTCRARGFTQQRKAASVPASLAPLCDPAASGAPSPSRRRRDAVHTTIECACTVNRAATTHRFAQRARRFLSAASRPARARANIRNSSGQLVLACVLKAPHDCTEKCTHVHVSCRIIASGSANRKSPAREK